VAPRPRRGRESGEAMEEYPGRTDEQDSERPALAIGYLVAKISLKNTCISDQDFWSASAL